MKPSRDAEGLEHGDAGRDDARWANVAFVLGCLSALVYFASSQGIRNFVSFLADGFVKVARLFGLSA